MPYVKPTIHISRIASSAVKTFTHGYVQTATALAARDHNSAPSLADTWSGRFGKASKSRATHVYQNVDQTRHASTATVPPARPETSHHDYGLGKYLDAWQKHQQNGSKDWQQFQFARRIEWHPPTVVPPKGHEGAVAATAEEVQDKKNPDLTAPVLKRSYTTSALDNFDKAFIHDEGAEAAALEQVNNAIAEEIQRSKDGINDGLLTKPATDSSASLESGSFHSDAQSGVQSPATVFTPVDSFSSSPSEGEIYTQELLQLAENKQYHAVPAAFQAILRAGVQKPTQAAYRALLTSAIELTPGKHQKVPKALEVYSDMRRRKIIPDTATYGILIDLLAKRSSEVMNMRKRSEERLVRYGGLEEPGTFMFKSSSAEQSILLEDSSLSTALKMFDVASQTVVDDLPSESCASLVVACAEQGRLEDMNRVYDHMESRALQPQSNVFPPIVEALGLRGDLNSAVQYYNKYKTLAVENNEGLNAIVRNDNDLYAALIKAFGTAGRLKPDGYKFLDRVQSEVTDAAELEVLRETVALQALLPLALMDPSFNHARELSESLTGHALTSALAKICIAAADRNILSVSANAFDSLATQTQDLTQPAMAMLAMHVRNANVEAGEPYWRILESALASLTFIEPTTMRTVALIGINQAERGLRHSRRMFARIRDSQPESRQAEAVEQVDEALELIGSMLIKNTMAISPASSLELLRAMTENGGLVTPVAEHLVARITADQIGRMNVADVEFLVMTQAGMILDAADADIAGPARFGCLLENVVTRSIMPSTETENLIEKALINIDRPELSRMWNNYRYPPTPAPVAQSPMSPTGIYRQQPPYFGGQAAFDESYDPYANRTDVKGSNAINELLERPQGRRMTDALTKFKNMRRVGRVPRMFTYGKLIESAAKENNLTLAHDILEMAKQDVPFDARYRVVRFGWQQILDHMVAGCLTIGRRDLASRYHQDLLDMAAAPSANTFGLYITTLKENTKTFDEASEAVKIFHRAKTEGVEPSSFLYNALIGKLGKARRIDDCLFYFAEMRNLGIRPTSVTYGTIVNALCRVSDEKFAEEIFEEMESCSNYKPRPAPYHSLMQFFLTTKRDRSKVLTYYERMRSKGIEPTVHTYKLLIDTHATLEPVNMPAAEKVLQDMRADNIQPEAVHYASLIHAKGCVLHDMAGARALFDSVIAEGNVRPQPCMYQAVFESMNANHMVQESDALLEDMRSRNVEFTPYIANALIHGWTLEKNIEKAQNAFDRVPIGRREPSTYEAMVRAYLAAENRDAAKKVVREALGRGYPSAVAGKIAELVR